jgi:hypothetical protein
MAQLWQGQKVGFADFIPQRSFCTRSEDLFSPITPFLSTVRSTFNSCNTNAASAEKGLSAEGKMWVFLPLTRIAFEAADSPDRAVGDSDRVDLRVKNARSFAA